MPYDFSICTVSGYDNDDKLQVGNAAYHDDRLYDQLQRCIPHLTRLLLEDEEDKTKANAAGALSNLVRNSSQLCDDIISKGAMQVSAISFFLLHILEIAAYAVENCQ